MTDWRRRPERGASAVEAALLSPFFVLLLVGLLEFAFYFKDYIAASASVRAGVRMASALPRDADYATATASRVRSSVGNSIPAGDVKQLWVYKANVNDPYPEGRSDFSGCTTCVKFGWDGTAFVPLSGSTWAPTSQVVCAGGPIDRVGVYLKVRHPAMTGMVFSSLDIEQYSVLRFEPQPAIRGCK